MKAVTTTPSVPPPARASAETRGSMPSGSAAHQLEQLRFLHEVARLATTARTWDELLETVVDRTRDVLHADVSSLYLLDRDGAYLTLAATNGLDRFQIGRARVPFGEGVTGQVAAERLPLVIPDVKADARFLWVRGIDQRRFVASMLSVPLSWHDQTVGVLNVQTEQPRTFTEADVAQLGAVADLLAGIIEKGRQQAEAEARVVALKAIDEARSELIALVTHELRTPLAVVRAYADLLADEPPLRGRESRDMERRARRAAWHRATLEQIERLDRLVDSILASVRVVPEGPASVTPVDIAALVDEVVGSLRPILERHRVEIVPSVRLQALADPPRLRQIVEHLVENAVKYAPPGHLHPDRLDAGRRDRPARRLRRGPRHPGRVAGADLRAVRSPRHSYRPRLGHRPVRRQATRRVHGRPPVVRTRSTARRAIRRRAAGRGRHLIRTREEHDHDAQPPPPDPCRG